MVLARLITSRNEPEEGADRADRARVLEALGVLNSEHECERGDGANAGDLGEPRRLQVRDPAMRSMTRSMSLVRLVSA